MIKIPKQLQNQGFRFVILGKGDMWKHSKTKEAKTFLAEDYDRLNKENVWKPLGKAPFELEWQTKNNYTFDDPKLTEHNGNIGVVGGYGNLRILDIDDKDFLEEIRNKLPKTFVVETGSGGKHFYFLSDYDKNHVLLDRKEELRANNYQVVIPGSIHPSGNKYKVIEDNPIIRISKGTLWGILEPYLRLEIAETQTDENKPKDESRSGKEYREVIKLIGKGKTKEEVFKEMEVYAKWATAPPQYREMTYNKAKSYLEKEKENEEKFEEKIKDYKGISKEDLRQEVYMFLLNKDKAKATELIVKSIEENEHIYTIREDENTEMWIYHKGIYIPYAKTFIKEWCREILNEVNTTFLSNQVIFKIETDTYIDKDDFFKEETPDLIPVQNGILNLRTRKLLPFSHKYKFFNKLPMKYKPESKCPNITRFFNSILRDEKDIEVLQEIFGCLLYKDYFLEKAFMFLGDGRNGKGKTLELMKKFLGVDNCSEITLEALETDQYALGELFKKMGNLCGDISATALKNSGNFKKLTGRDLVSASRKFLTRIHFINYAKMVFSANQLPFTYDKKLAFFSRWVIINFPFTFLPQKEFEAIDITKNEGIKLQDPEIVEKIATEEELEGLLNIALDGLDRLFKNKTCSYSPSIKEVEIEWLRKSNSFNAFYMDCLEEKYDGKITKTELRRSYSLYCREHKLLMVGDKSIKHILEEFGAGEDYLTNADGDRVYCWVGLKFNKNVQGEQDEQGFTTYREFTNIPRS